MNVRRASLDDLETVTAVVRETVEEMAAYGNDQWDASYPDEDRFRQDVANGALLLAEEDGGVAGFITVDREEPKGYEGLPWSDAEQCLVIHRFAVARRSRGRGVASFLEEAVRRMAVEEGVHLIKVDTHSTNLVMQTFLEKKGYRKVGEMQFLGKSRPFFCFEKPV